MRKRIRNFLFLLLTAVSAAGVSTADVRLPSVIGSNMVLQTGMAVPLWGWASPGETVTVSFREHEYTVKAGRDGSWSVRVETMEPGGPFELSVRGKNTMRLSNVLVGEVWVCSGQSNMEMRVRHVDDADNEVAGALHRTIRLFQITNDLSPEPRRDCEGRWEICRPSTVGDFSAVGYFFGMMLMQELDVPVGLINASWGGTTVESWISEDAKQGCAEFRDLLDHWAPVLAAKPPEVLAFYRQMAEWEEDVHYVEYVGKPLLAPYGEVPRSPVKLAIVPQMPMWVRNAMLEPIIPFGIRGVIWYQGESNAGRAVQYRSLFPAMIEDWRRLWGQGDFPFLFVQLANFGKELPEPGDSAWAELREAQLMTLAVPNTAMSVTIDIGEGNNIHPRNKQEVGRRLALGALNTVYGREVVHSGPIYAGMEKQGDEIRLCFHVTGSGLAVKGGGPLRGFAIAGSDRKFVWAEARIEDGKVVVWNSNVPDPVSVRYGWADNPSCNLYNREYLPASPFRTDDWPGITAGVSY